MTDIYVIIVYENCIVRFASVGPRNRISEVRVIPLQTDTSVLYATTAEHTT